MSDGKGGGWGCRASTRDDVCRIRTKFFEGLFDRDCRQGMNGSEVRDEDGGRGRNEEAGSDDLWNEIEKTKENESKLGSRWITELRWNVKMRIGLRVARRPRRSTRGFIKPHLRLDEGRPSTGYRPRPQCFRRRRRLVPRRSGCYSTGVAVSASCLGCALRRSAALLTTRVVTHPRRYTESGYRPSPNTDTSLASIVAA